MFVALCVGIPWSTILPSAFLCDSMCVWSQGRLNVCPCLQPSKGIPMCVYVSVPLQVCFYVCLSVCVSECVCFQGRQQPNPTAPLCTWLCSRVIFFPPNHRVSTVTWYSKSEQLKDTTTQTLTWQRQQRQACLMCFSFLRLSGLLCLSVFIALGCSITALDPHKAHRISKYLQICVYIYQYFYMYM